jgi:hypothetical protein
MREEQEDELPSGVGLGFWWIEQVINSILKGDLEADLPGRISSSLHRGAEVFREGTC